MARYPRIVLRSAVMSLLVVPALAGPALACGGLVAPGHAEVLRRATTLAAWHDGFEHYVTGFQFAGSAHSFGYIVPLPAVPTRIQKAGDWTLERLQLEVGPQRFAVAALADSLRTAAVQVVKKVKVEALDITVVRGGGRDVAAWAQENGFDLTPDTPEILGAYGAKGAIFALARFDAPEARRRGLVEGQGTVIHFTIPTRAPWIPLRILALGKAGPEVVEADLFVLTDRVPRLSPGVGDIPGMTTRSEGPASGSLLADLRSDRGMGWLPADGMWLTALSLRAPAGTIDYDLSIDGGAPDRPAGPASEPGFSIPPGVWVLATLTPAAVAVAIALGTRPRPSVS